MTLINRNTGIMMRDNVELLCRVKGPNMPRSLTWIHNNDDIVTLKYDGGISWSGDQHHYQVKVDRRHDATVYYLQIIGASRREDGLYQCRVSVFLDNAYRKLPLSNQLTVKVQNPGTAGVQELLQIQTVTYVPFLSLPDVSSQFPSPSFFFF